jgi:hypothetical protein
MPNIDLTPLKKENERLRKVNAWLVFWLKYIQSKDDINHIHDVAGSAILKAKEVTE